MALARQRMTADEFLALPPTDHFRHAELIDGEVVVCAPNAGHQRIVMHLFRELTLWMGGDPARGELLPMTVRCSPVDAFVPDLLWLRPERRPAPDAGHLDVAPDLVAEVRSPSTWRYDVGHKRRQYEAMGVIELWLADGIEERVTVARRTAPDAPAFDDERTLGRGDTLTTPLLPGFAVDVAALFDAAR